MALQLKATLITFHHLHGGHNDESLTSTVMQLLDRTKITLKVSNYKHIVCQGQYSDLDTFLNMKVGHFTLDNVRSNDTMMRTLKRMFAACNIDFDVGDHKIICFGHINGLSSGQVILGVTKTNTFNTSPTQIQDGSSNLVYCDHAVV